MVPVGPHGQRVPIAHLGEEAAQPFGRAEAPDALPQGEIVVLADAVDIPPIEEVHVLGDGLIEEAIVILGAGDALLLRELTIAVLLELERGNGACQLAPHHGELLAPGVGDEVDVVHVPVVVVDADPGGAVLRRQLRLQPHGEFVAGDNGFLNGSVEIDAGSSHPFGQPAEGRTLALERPDAHSPEISGVLHQVAAGLLEQRRNGSDPAGKLGGALGAERIVVGPGIDPAVNHRALVRRHVTFGREDADIEGRIAGPRAAHPMIEVEAVHLGLHHVVVDLLCDRPAARVDRRQAGLIVGQLALLRRHGRGRVVVHAVHEHRLLEVSPVLEQCDEIVVIGARGHGATATFGGDAGSTGREGQDRHGDNERGDGGRAKGKSVEHRLNLQDSGSETDHLRHPGQNRSAPSSVLSRLHVK